MTSLEGWDTTNMPTPQLVRLSALRMTIVSPYQAMYGAIAGILMESSWNPTLPYLEPHSGLAPNYLAYKASTSLPMLVGLYNYRVLQVRDSSI